MDRLVQDNSSSEDENDETDPRGTNSRKRSKDQQLKDLSRSSPKKARTTNTEKVPPVDSVVDVETMNLSDGEQGNEH